MFVTPPPLVLSGLRSLRNNNVANNSNCSFALGKTLMQVFRRGFAVATVTRSPQFAQLNDADVEQFRKILGEDAKGGLITDESDLEKYNRDWMGRFKGRSRLAMLPKTTQQVSEILRYCNSRKIAVVPQGGNTGLVGGSVPVFDEVILSTSRMNNILWFDSIFGAVGCQAGVILQNLGQAAEAHGHIVPLDLGAKGSCHIGGNLATNAGGLRYLRYGSLHGNVLGLEVVLPDGTILNNMGAALRKDNTGYDLKQIFIGSEGSLGVITAAAIICPTKPNAVNVGFFGVQSFEAVQAAFAKAKKDLGEILSAYEFLDRESLEVVLQHSAGRGRDPLPSRYPFYVLIETSGSNNQHDAEKLSVFMEDSIEKGIIGDGTAAQDQKQASGLWYLREGIAESLSKSGAVYKYDVSLPLPRMYDLVRDTRTRLQDITDAKTYGYGHLGDGNLHLNVVVPKYEEKVQSRIEPYVYEYTKDLKGSISAEHGLGFAKANYIHYSKSDPMIKWMKKVKQLFDPNGIMNPYKVLPSH